jgi:hypothetical protein
VLVGNIGATDPFKTRQQLSKLTPVRHRQKKEKRKIER